MHDAAIDKIVFCKNVLQDFIVGMGIGPKIVVTGEAPVETGFGNPSHRAVGCQPVYRGIGPIVEPASVVDTTVIGVFARNQAESRHYSRRSIDHTIAMTVFHITPHLLFRRIAIDPLGRISVARIKARALSKIRIRVGISLRVAFLISITSYFGAKIEVSVKDTSNRAKKKVFSFVVFL